MKFQNLFFIAGLSLAMAACSKPAASEATNTPAPVVDPAPAADAGPVAEKAPEAALETLTGTYVSTDQGDYFHANVKGDDGNEYSFFFANELESARAEEMIEGLWDGKKVKVQWRKVERDIPENGGPMELDEIVSIEAL